ncbi:hypothetical protein P7K49_019590 [Saguinus oedipus]|uniref:Monocarboxylate transporter 2 n=1 Tax=Saguinus oedipus TaxID=9490 RepID=A0ABQ9UXX6_SAGOE|nr:hypothetical protein P7K49_019590 [Saguinus oedipus]
MVLASFSSSVVQLYITMGFITGLGLAFNLQPALTIIGKYFYRKRPMANGLAMAGSPVFLSSLAPFNQYLFNTFGWKGSFLILGGLLLNACVAGSLMRPLGPNQTTSKSKNNTGIREDDSGLKKIKTQKSTWEKVNKYLDFSLFKHRGFLIYLSGNVIMFLGFFAPIIFLAPYAKDQGIDEYSAAFLLSIMAFVDMFARPSVGLIANSKYIRPRIQYFFSFAIMFNGVCHLLCPLAQDYTSLILYAVFFGLGFGSVSSVLFETLMDLVGAPRFSSAVGLVTIVECGPVLLGPPLADLSSFDTEMCQKCKIVPKKTELSLLLSETIEALVLERDSGMLVDVTGEYKYMYMSCGAIVVAASVWLLIGNAINYRLLAKERKEENARKTTRESEPLSKPNHPEDVHVKVSNAQSITSERETNI